MAITGVIYNLLLFMCILKWLAKKNSLFFELKGRGVLFLLNCAQEKTGQYLIRN
jgi:hypothetical protein